ncbi:MAG: cell division protein ZapA [Rhodobacterales bacterium]|nr:MAG: cell division protein ZapA [Rhodobacterales bacterium]
MPEVTITIGNRDFEVACQEGEEHFLRTAAEMLDTEAQALADQMRHLTESRMLLMAGLMLADKTAGIDDKFQIAQKQIAALEAELAETKQALAKAKAGAELSGDLADGMAELAARAEAIADVVEAKLDH